MLHAYGDQAMAHAYLSGADTMKEIAEAFGVHYMTVSRGVRKVESASGLLDCWTGPRRSRPRRSPAKLDGAP